MRHSLSLGPLFALLATTSVAAIELIDGPTLTMNPGGESPLAGLIEMTADAPTRLAMAVSDGTDTWAVVFPAAGDSHAVPLLGLKPNRAYTITFRLTDASTGTLVAEPMVQATTGPLPIDFPEMRVSVSEPASMEPGFTLLAQISRGRRADPGLPLYTIIVDNLGEVVWYSTRGSRNIYRLPNGNIQYRSDTDVIEEDLLGNVVSVITLADPGLGLHHDLQPTAHGTFLSMSRETLEVDGYPTSDSDPNAPTQTATILDTPAVEFAADGSLLNIWRFTEMLDPTRIGYGGLNVGAIPGALNWAHGNAVLHDATDDTIIASLRRQDAVVKFSRTTGELIWILGSPATWAPEFQPYLLEPVDTPFAWQFQQHAPMITERGTLLLFDNGNFRASPFDGAAPVRDEDNYSRAVEYEIDVANMQVRQVWQTGEELPPRLFSPSVGDADDLPATGNVLITFGGVTFVDGVAGADLGVGARSAHIVEVTRDTPAQKVFELAVYETDPSAQTVVYRADRISSLYGDDVLVAADQDADAVPDSLDNCPGDANGDQSDSDGDGIGDVCDTKPRGSSSGGIGALDHVGLGLLLTLACYWASRTRRSRLRGSPDRG